MIRKQILFTALISGTIGYSVSEAVNHLSFTHSETKVENHTQKSVETTSRVPQEIAFKDDGIEIPSTKELDYIKNNAPPGLQIIEKELNRYGYNLSSLNLLQWQDFVSDKAIDYWLQELRSEIVLLNLAIILRNTPIIKKLLSKKINIDYQINILNQHYPLEIAGQYGDLESFKLIVDNVSDINASKYENIVKIIKKDSQRARAKSKIDYLFNSGYVFNNMNLQILPLLSFSEDIETPELINTLATINPNAPIQNGRSVVLAKMILEGANDETVLATLPYFDPSKVSMTAAASILVNSMYSKRIKDSATITALINHGLDVNALMFGRSSILMNSVGAIIKAENDQQFEIQKAKISALINAGADRHYIDSRGENALTILNRIRAKEEYKQQIREMLE